MSVQPSVPDSARPDSEAKSSELTYRRALKRARAERTEPLPWSLADEYRAIRSYGVDPDEVDWLKVARAVASVDLMECRQEFTPKSARDLLRVHGVL